RLELPDRPGTRCPAAAMDAREDHLRPPVLRRGRAPAGTDLSQSAGGRALRGPQFGAHLPRLRFPRYQRLALPAPARLRHLEAAFYRVRTGSGRSHHGGAVRRGLAGRQLERNFPRMAPRWSEPGAACGLALRRKRPQSHSFSEVRSMIPVWFLAGLAVLAA